MLAEVQLRLDVLKFVFTEPTLGFGVRQTRNLREDCLLTIWLLGTRPRVSQVDRYIGKYQ
jgi:hypothetical protein